jgi:hypothetical protein
MAIAVESFGLPIEGITCQHRLGKTLRRPPKLLRRCAEQALRIVQPTDAPGQFVGPVTRRKASHQLAIGFYGPLDLLS